MEKCQGVRRLGAAAIDLAYVACGRYEGYWEFNIQPWDIAAGILLVTEAGGRISDFKGNPLNLDKPLQILSSNGSLHPILLDIFRKTL
jgi:myo-inositol-1(or 4)-monophosphatase